MDNPTINHAKDPQPGDEWRKGALTILVHMVENGWVYFGELIDGHSFLCGHKMTLAKFEAAVETEGAEFVEEDVTHG